ncbi:MFS transporter [Rhizobium helianthi]|uniref:MFS transporter n=1 Tax=Rhizobium helianthi TaxID=1132695 RepID=UPI00366DD875
MAQSPQLHSPHLFAFRCAVAYAAALGVNGILLPFFPVWLKSLSMSDFEVGLILTLPIIMRVVTAPAVGLLADRLKERTHVLIVSAGIALLSAIALLWSRDFWTVLIVFGLQGAAFAPFIPILESVTVMGVRRWGHRYGSIRVWGSIGFVAITLSAGAVIARLGGGVVPLGTIIVFCFALVSAFIAPRLGPANAMPKSAMARSSLPFTSSLNLLMIGCCITQSTHGMYYAFSGIYWESVGFSGSQIGFLWSAGVLAEIVFFFAAGSLASRISPVSMILIGSSVAVLRWCLFALPLGFEASMLLQCSHAFSFAFLHFGMQQKIVEVVHESRESSVQGRFFFYNGAFLAASTFFSGAIYHALGQHAYFIMAALAFLGLLVSLHVQRSGWKV